ncbi:sugar transferase [Romboutsia ilealis]|uniref:Sugar transferase n=1 Tax=Romboutsia faecis TaxID=2764597 RepID=A0ABR7JLM0_9FIRM|nr:sugar transferase [Romboutsia faecis]MBC5995804.1 sugar transferase [Romboutsia faecis]MRN23003.1 sugar transferase [Romboutsia ilealis]
MYKIIKRIIDIMIAICLIILSTPIMIIASVAIKFDDPRGPILFKQDRIGYKNKIFKVCKFRTMRVEVEKRGKKLSDEERMLKVGRILRKLSIDELPQMINILKGEMSFIGPRPLPVRYLDYYNEEEIKRHNVRPGISGLAQINGRNTLNWEDRFRLDVFYVENISLIQDIKISIKTVKKVILGSDVVTRGEVNLLDFDKHRELQESNT